MKEKLEIKPYQVARVIEHRRYHNIRKWLVRLVDEEVMRRLLHDMAKIIKEEYQRFSDITSPEQLKGCSQLFKNLLTFLKDCHEYSRNLGCVRIVRYILNEYNCIHIDDVTHVIPYLIENDSQWNSVKKLIQKTLLSRLSHDNGTILLSEFRSVTYLMTGKVSTVLTDMVLTLHDEHYMKQINAGGNIASISHKEELQCNRGIMAILTILNGHETTQYYVELLDVGAKLANESHPLCRPKYTLGAIWEYCPWYYPANVKDYMVVLAYLHTNVNSGQPVELNDRLLPILKRIAYEAPVFDYDIMSEVVDYICELTLRRLDNVRFLVPFRSVKDEAVEYSIGKTLRNVMATLINLESNKTLRDFKFLLDNFNSPVILSNDKLQRGFLMHGGKPSTLLRSHLDTDVRSYIYTVEGLILAINKSTSSEMEILIHDEAMATLMISEIIGKTYYYNTVSYITQAIINTKEVTPMIESMIMKINISYPVSDSDYDKYRLMISNMKRFDTGITDKYDLLRYLPLGQQSYLSVIADITSKDEYVPLWYGVNSNSGINHWMPMDVFRRKLPRMDVGYIGDISSPALGKLLLSLTDTSK